MRKIFAALSALCACVGIQACDGDDDVNPANPLDAGHTDATTDSGAGNDSSSGTDTSTATDSGAQNDVTTADANDGGCPAAWTAVPTVDPSIAVPADGGGLLLHASATGTQDYTCTTFIVDAGPDADAGPGHQWTFVGPEADLKNCAGANVAKHFASDGGPTLPEWITTADGTYVIAKRVAGYTPDASAIPWLLLQEQSTGGSGTLSKTAYIQRLNTTGGNAPAAGSCDQAAEGTTQKVPYTADYYFYGTP
jgi:Protein of unknown function (DUF3455)